MGGRRQGLIVLRDALVVAGVAVLTVQALRRWVCDRYLVPSGSMQPMLFGDPERGDIVFVDKTASAADMRRGDVVVVADERRRGHQLVKRIAARGDDRDACWIDIRNGDVWLGPDRQHLQREVKEPRRALARSVTWASDREADDRPARLDLGSASRGDDGCLRWPGLFATVAAARDALRSRQQQADDTKGGAPPGAITTAVPVDASYLDIEGRRSAGGSDVPVIDCGMSLRFVAAPGAVLCTIDTRDVATTFVFTPERDRVEVWIDDQLSHQADDVLQKPWRGGLWFGRLDGRDYLLLDDDGEVVVATPPPPASALPRPHTWLHVVTSGDQVARCSDVRVFRDIYSWRQPALSVGGAASWPRFVAPGHWFLLGDNPFDSEDSRVLGDVAAADLLGVPRWAVGPAGRLRELLR